MTADALTDNRRTVVRVLALEILRGLRDVAHIGGGDLNRAVIFTAVWALNTQHLTAPDGRYAGVYDLPPDRERRPVTLGELTDWVVLDEALVLSHLDRLIADGVCERTPTGYVVPSAFFTRPEMVDGLNQFYTGIVRLVSALQNAGFRMGEVR